MLLLYGSDHLESLPSTLQFKSNPANRIIPFTIDSLVVRGGSIEKVTITNLSYVVADIIDLGDLTITIPMNTLDPPSLLLPENNSIDIAVPTNLFWNLVPSATNYNLNIATDSTFEHIVYNKSNIVNTNQEVTTLTNFQKHFWRVRAGNDIGYSEWSEIWNFVVEGALPFVPQLIKPENNAIDVDVEPIFTWERSKYADNYELQVSSTNQFVDSLSFYETVIDTIFNNFILKGSTKYYWRVRSSNSMGYSDFSNVYSFNTKETVPLAPSLASPANAAVEIQLNPIFIWNVASGAVEYQLQIALDEEFSQLVFDKENIQNTNEQVSGVFERSSQYFWRVRAKNDYGFSEWSEVWTFKTISSCPDIEKVEYMGITYNTVLIGEQCWLKENLDVGSMIDGSVDMTNDGTVEKYCFDNDPANCETYGGLYQWDEALQYTSGEGSRGICPAGWHIPSKSDYKTLIAAVDSNGNSLKAVGEGNSNGQGTNSSGFSALLAGRRNNDGSFVVQGYHGSFWTSTLENNHPFYLRLININNGIFLFSDYDKNYGLSIRCVKD